jgi:hypothetical protein
MRRGDALSGLFSEAAEDGGSLWTTNITECNFIATWDHAGKISLAHIAGGRIEDVPGVVKLVLPNIEAELEATIIVGSSDGASQTGVDIFLEQFKEKLEMEWKANNLVGKNDQEGVMNWVTFVTDYRRDGGGKGLNRFSFVISTDGRYGRVLEDDGATEEGQGEGEGGGEDETQGEGEGEGEAGEGEEGAENEVAPESAEND